VPLAVPDFAGGLFLTWCLGHYLAFKTGIPAVYGAAVRLAGAALIMLIWPAGLPPIIYAVLWAGAAALIDHLTLRKTPATAPALTTLTITYALHISAAALLFFASSGSASAAPVWPRTSYQLFGLPVGPLLATVGLLILATHPANHLVRSVLQSALGGKTLAQAELLAAASSARSAAAAISISAATSAAAATAASAEESPTKPHQTVRYIDLQMGRVIGSLERLLIIILVINGSYEALAFAVGVKSLVRYPRLSEPHFAEYFLVGTLTSALVGVALGLTIKLIW